MHLMFFDSFVYNKNLRKVCNCLELYLVLFFSKQTNYLNLFLVFSNSFVVNESSVLGFCFVSTLFVFLILHARNGIISSFNIFLFYTVPP